MVYWRGIVNDWQNQGVLIAQTGSPYTISSYTDTGATGIGGDFADLVSGVTHNPAHRGVVVLLQHAAFTEAADGTYGTSSRGMLFGPSRVNMDFSLFKEFPDSRVWEDPVPKRVLQPLQPPELWQSG